MILFLKKKKPQRNFSPSTLVRPPVRPYLPHNKHTKLYNPKHTAITQTRDETIKNTKQNSCFPLNPSVTVLLKPIPAQSLTVHFQAVPLASGHTEQWTRLLSREALEYSNLLITRFLGLISFSTSPRVVLWKRRIQRGLCHIFFFFQLYLTFVSNYWCSF